MAPDPLQSIAPIADALFTAPPAPRLIGGRHRETGRLVFPLPAGAPDQVPEPLPATGTLWSWTVQRFRPKSPPYAGAAAFEPYAVGYVELGGAIIVEGRLTGLPVDDWAIGMAMRTVLLPFERAAGEAVLLFAFAPDAGRAG